MPALDRWAAVQLGLLLFAIPAQYIITEYMSSNDTQRHYALKKLVNNVVDLQSRYLTWSHWQKWCQELFIETSTEASDDFGESPAVEVLKYRDPDGHFAGSTEARSPRPPHIKFRVGQVIKHKKWGYRGVIVGWDSVAKAPEEWLGEMHPKDKREWRYMPNYSVLVDTRDRNGAQKTYVVEENIEVIQFTEINHPQIGEYFDSFDGSQYIKSPWLKKLYPHD